MLVGKQKLYLIFESKLKRRRAQVEVRPAGRGGCQVHHLQRRRGRPRRVHGPQRPGRRPAQRHRRHGHRRLRHRRRRKGYIYVRAEYPLAVERLKIAIEQARELRPAGREHPRAPASISTSRSAWAPARSSAAKRPR